MRLRLLIANDDGISVGLQALADVADEAGHDVFIATTNNHSSGSSKSISFKTRYKLVKLFGKYNGIVVESTPATAVGVVLDSIDKHFDFVVSGVNSGPNLGLWDVLSSGTVGAVLEAVTRGLKGIAVSLVAREWSEYNRLGYDEYYKAAKIGINLLEILASEAWLAPILNVNVPVWNVRGVRVAVLETGIQSEVYVCGEDTCDMSRWTLEEAYRCLTPGSDVCLIKQGYVTITPLIHVSTASLDWLEKALSKALKDDNGISVKHNE